jgi:hypothetical protein
MFHTISHITLPSYPHNIQDATTQNECEEACLNDCSCTAYSYSSGRCSIWRGELFSVSQNDGIENFSDNVLYLRLAARSMQSFGENNKI